jgi:hypothetical protein
MCSTLASQNPALKFTRRAAVRSAPEVCRGVVRIVHRRLAQRRRCILKVLRVVDRQVVRQLP